ncbi:hypothetical protein F4679DRAFT_535387 [Xylaria curta]|nr:hypothetical protein F4679DRAFT_535387 [Xylaria curta]
MSLFGPSNEAPADAQSNATIPQNPQPSASRTSTGWHSAQPGVAGPPGTPRGSPMIGAHTILNPAEQGRTQPTPLLEHRTISRDNTADKNIRRSASFAYLGSRLKSTKKLKINSLEPIAHGSHVKEPSKYRYIVFYCCQCGDGPWNPQITSLCQNCQHKLCGDCRSDQQR